MTLDLTAYYTKSALVRDINKKLVDQGLTFDELQLFIDSCIDDINNVLNATYPTTAEMDLVNLRYHGSEEDISKLPEIYTKWKDGLLTLFPAAVVRKVIVTGAAYKWLTADEEGISVATTYGQEYQSELYNLQRDYSNQVPVEFCASESFGFINSTASNKGISFYDSINDKFTSNRGLDEEGEQNGRYINPYSI